MATSTVNPTYLDESGEPITAGPDVKVPKGYALLSSKSVTAGAKAVKPVKELKITAAKLKPVLPPKGYIPTSQLSAYTPSALEQLRNTVANSAIGHSLESTLPGIADALNLHPSETVNSPTYEQHKNQLIAPEYATDLASKIISAQLPVPLTQAGQDRLSGVMKSVGGLTTPENLGLLAGTAGLGEAFAGTKVLGQVVKPILSPAVTSVLGRLAAGGFSLDMLRGLYQQNKEYRKAVDSGDLSEAHKIQGEMGVTGIMAALAAKHSLTGHPYTPIKEPVSRERTNVLHSNAAGQVRQAPGEAPAVWLSPDAWKKFSSQMFPGEEAGDTHGVNIEANDNLRGFATDPRVTAENPELKDLQELFAKAHENANKGGVAVAKKRGSIQDNIRVIREELNHTWQRNLSQTGDYRDHLTPEAFGRLNQIIPDGMRKHLVSVDYDEASHPQMVTEAAAKLMGGDLDYYGVTPEETASFMKSYLDEVVKQHGTDALNNLKRVRGVAAKAKEAANAEHAGKSTGTNGAADRGSFSGIPEGRGRAPESVQGESGQGQAGEVGDWGEDVPLFNREKAKEDSDKFRTAITQPVYEEGVAIPSVDVDVKFPPPKEMEGAWRDASMNPALHEQFKRTGITGFSIEEPYKFGLSVQGDIDPKTGQIRMSAAAANPSQTLAHEVSHDIYRRLTPQNRTIIENYVKNATHIYPNHTGGLEERIVDHFADDIAAPMSSSIPPSLRKIFFESPLEPRPAAPPEPKLPAVPEPKRPIYGTWSDLAQMGGTIRMGDDIRGLVAKDGDFPLVVKDTYGARHIMPASIAADVLDSPAHNYVEQVFMAKDHIYDKSTPELKRELERDKKMLQVNGYMSVKPGIDEPDPSRPLRESYRKELEANVAKAEKILADRKAGVPHKPVPVVPPDTVRTQSTGARMLTDAIKTFGNRDRLAAEYKAPQLPAGQDALFNREKDKPIWYLKSEKLIGEKMRGPMPGQDVSKMLIAGGVKPEEMHWTGLDDFLKERGKDKVTPQEIREHLANNNIQIKEVTKGSNVPSGKYLMFDENGDFAGSTDDEEEALHHGKTTRGSWADRNDNAGRYYLENAGTDTKYGSYVLPGGKEYREMLLTMPPKSPAPIKLNWTETKTNDSLEAPVFFATNGKKAFVVTQEPTGKWRVVDDPQAAVFKSADDAKSYVEKGLAPRPDASNQFRSNHWEEPNPLAHVRYNDRTSLTYTPEDIQRIESKIQQAMPSYGPASWGSGATKLAVSKGLITPEEAAQYSHAKGWNNDTSAAQRKLLHVEEVQSDWHQKGRDVGYEGDYKPLTELPQGYSVKSEKMDNGDEIFWISDPEGKRITARSYNKQGSINEALNALNDKARGTTASPVPNAPFKKTWHEMALRRILKMAADKGYDAVSWTGGEDQADRYSLAKQISRLEYFPVDGTLNAFDHSGSRVMREVATPEELPDYIGKEAANKLLQTPRVDTDTMKEGDETTVEYQGKQRRVKIHPDRRLNEGKNSESVMVTGIDDDRNMRWFVPLADLETHTLANADLKVGGEGMKGFYDKIVPDYLNKFGKKYGAKVGTTEINTGEPMSPEVIEKMTKQIKNDPRLGEMPLYAHVESDGYYYINGDAQPADSGAVRTIQVADKEGNISKDFRSTKTVQYLPITPEMRQSVGEEGVPLFNREKGYNKEDGPDDTARDPREAQRRRSLLEEASVNNAPRGKSYDGVLPEGKPYAYTRRIHGDGDSLRVLGSRVRDSWSLDPKQKAALEAKEWKSPDMHELDYNDPNSVTAFHDSISKIKSFNKFGAAVHVYSPEEYGAMRMFLSADGTAGFALKPDGDIVSVFSHGADAKGSSHTMLEIAKRAGGKKMDAFDTILPKLYGDHGFRAVARMKWNEEYAPEGWDKELFKKFSNGEPDVVFMSIDQAPDRYSAEDGKTVDDYDEAVRLQQEAVDGNKDEPLFNREQVKTPEFKAFFDGSKVVDKDGEPMVLYHGTRSSKDFSEFSTTGPVADEDDDEQMLSSGSGADPTAYMGAHFAQEPEVANKFAKGSGWMSSRYEHGETKPRVIPAYLSITKPKVFGAETNMRNFIYKGKLSGYAGDAMLDSAMYGDGIEDAEDPDDPRVEEWMKKYDEDPDFRLAAHRYIFERIGHSSEENTDHLEAAADLARQAQERLKAAGYDGVKYKNEVEGGTSWIAFKPEQIKSAIGNSGAFDPKDPSILRNREKNPKFELPPWDGDGRNGIFPGYEPGGKLSKIQQIPIGKLNPTEDNTDPETVNNLVYALKYDDGKDIPAIIVELAHDGSYDIVDGHNRFKAAGIAGYKNVPVRIWTSPDDINYNALRNRETPSAAGQESVSESNTDSEESAGQIPEPVEGSTGTAPTTVDVPGLGKLNIDEKNSMYFVYLGGKNIATASLSDDGTYFVSVNVDPEYRRKGVATALYDFVEKHIGHPLRPSPNYQSEGAKKLWEKRGGQDSVPVQGGTKLASAPVQTPAVPVPKKNSNTVASSIEKGTPGECFSNARKWAWDHEKEGAVLVHGKAKTQNGKLIDHAWVELGDEVVDPTVGIRMPKDEYYRQASATPMSRYAPDKAMANMVRAGHQGPWTEQDLSPTKKVLPLAQLKAMAAGLNPNPERQVKSVTELMREARSRMVP